ncbi:MAG: DUF433 domain-containing protein [Janthinobacterium lividum]
MPTLLNRVTASREVMLGKPVIRGTRLTMELLVRKLLEGATTVDLLRIYPQLTVANVAAVAASRLAPRQ